MYLFQHSKQCARQSTTSGIRLYCNNNIFSCNRYVKKTKNYGRQVFWAAKCLGDDSVKDLLYEVIEEIDGGFSKSIYVHHYYPVA